MMGLGPSLPFDNADGFSDDWIIGKAMEAIRIRFPKLPESFYGDNWERARLILRVEGRDTQTVVSSLLPFAEAQSSAVAIRKRNLQQAIKELETDFPHMAKMIEKGLL